MTPLFFMPEQEPIGGEKTLSLLARLARIRQTGGGFYSILSKSPQVTVLLSVLQFQQARSRKEQNRRNSSFENWTLFTTWSREFFPLLEKRSPCKSNYMCS